MKDREGKLVEMKDGSIRSSAHKLVIKFIQYNGLTILNQNPIEFHGFDGSLVVLKKAGKKLIFSKEGYRDLFWKWAVSNGYAIRYKDRNKELRKKTKDKKIKKRNQYFIYLKSLEWKVKSKLCITRAGNRCEVCSFGRLLHAHHFNYDNLYKETEYDLFCLCRLCHMVYHDKVGRIPSMKGSRPERLEHIKKTILSNQNKT